MKEEEKRTYPYIHRDVSWLSFNYRVLQEAKDPSVPLYEKIKFLAIYSSNLDEFFRVRVAGIRNLVRVVKKTKRQLDFEPEQILKRIRKIVNRQQVEYEEIFKKQIIPQLRAQGIHLMRSSDLNEAQQHFIEDYFQDNLLPFVQPVLLVKKKIRPFLNNAALYLALLLQEKPVDGGDAKKRRYAILKIPSDHLPRFIQLPSDNPDQHDIMLLDDIVRISAQWIFPGYDILNTHSIKLTRDA
ncbi:MAG: polyphosphate kinase 1, partial [Bacteroidota bacterium]